MPPRGSRRVGLMQETLQWLFVRTREVFGVDLCTVLLG